MSRLPLHPVDAVDSNLRGPAATRDLEARVAALERALSSGRVINIQTIAGTVDRYQPISGGTGNFYRDAALTLPLQLTYTPPVNCYWEVGSTIGILQKVDAAYHYAYAQLTLSTPDADGATSAPNILTQHTQVDDYAFRAPRRVYKLVAGTTYVCSTLFSSSGGSWNYYQGKDYMFMDAKAYTR